MEKNTKYFIGLDEGTNSIGFAVVDDNYNLVKKNGKHLWGVRLFDEGVDASGRRLQRGQRRRIERRKERIRLLQELFAPLMSSVDENFFKKLKQSFLQNVEDDNEFGRVNIYNLFDGDYNDVDYYTEYPSIYHLRKDLMEKDKKFDVRLVYLAIHNLIKYRGNFLYEDEEVANCGANIEQGLKDFFDNLDEYYSVNDFESFGEINYVELNKTLLDKKIKRFEKKDLLKNMFSSCFVDKAQGEQIASLLLGYECDISKIFNIALEEDLTKEQKQAYKISLNGESFEERIGQIEDVVEESVTQILREIKKVYDSIKFTDILGENNHWIYQGMLEKYKKYGEDLDVLRKLIKENVKNQEFIDFYFKSEKDAEKYANAVVIKKNKKGYSIGVKRNATTKDENQKNLKKIIENCKDCEDKKYILDELKNETFLKPLNTVENGVVPYQILLDELTTIIDNQSKYYEYLTEIKEKLVSIMSFRRPYFVGVLNPESKFAWIEEKINERVYPWNFENLVNYEQLQEKFIENLTGHCAFFSDNEVLPKCSIIYQKYLVLNQINAIKVKNYPISAKQKQSIYENLFLKQKIVKAGDIVKHLKDKFDCVATKEDIESILSDKSRFLSMSSYIDMKKIFGENFNDIELYDKIIKKLTIFNDKKTREKSLQKLGVEQDKIAKLLRLNYSGWGKFSKKLLTQVYDENGRNILQVMYDENRQFNSIIYDETLSFYNVLFKKNTSLKQNIAYSDLVKNEYASPSVKRTVWQAIKVVQEIVKIMGCKPQGIFIESTREESVKKQTSTRLDSLKELYKFIKKDCEYYNKELGDFLKGDEKEINQKLKSDFVYLYMLQMGRSMYSGKPLDINNLSTTCEIDHIVPRCYIKDDSISNRVLVLKDENQKKTGSLGIQVDVVKNMRSFWEFLFKNKFISKKKFNNLNKTEYTENELKGFINRQLTNTAQSAKLLRDTLKKIYDSDVDMINAGLSAQLRKCMIDKDDVSYYSFYKIRELNDFHHAKDAYLAAVLSMFVKYAFPVWGQTDEAKYYKKQLVYAETEGRAKELVNKRYGIIIDKLIYGADSEFDADENGEILWNNVKFNNFLRTMDLNDCLVSKKLEFISDQAFYNQTTYSPSDARCKIPQRTVVNNFGEVEPLPAERYGGFSGEGRAYFVNIRYKKGKKFADEVYFVPTIIDKKLGKDKNVLVEYFKEKLLNNKRELVEVSQKYLYKYQQIVYNGQRCLMASESEIQNATQLVVKRKFNKMLSYVAKNKGVVNEKIENNREEFEPLINEFILEYVSKVSKDYYGNYNDIARDVENYFNGDFISLDYDKKIELVYKLLLITKSGSKAINLSEIKGKSSAGRMYCRTITTENTKFYDVSITGFFVKEIEFKWAGE